ncbi:MAG TPA: hypothetical protein VG186_14580 [Solirubrobacteraceae bacterium]|jgi:hypothetical protein|nr:hypothetical protein [Solirubrobacteraceae bacterium]
MFRRSLALAPALAALTLAAPALADTGSVTATGSAEVKVVPTDRQSNASIVSAVAAAQKQAVPGAVSAAHAKALLYAQSAGLTLGAVLSVSDADNAQYFLGPYGPGGSNIGPFGPDKYCGIERRSVVKRSGNRIRVVKVIKVHRCVVPGYASSTLAVTYTAT